LYSEIEENEYGEVAIKPSDMIDWLVKRKKHIAKNTFRQYKSALMFYFDKHKNYQDFSLAKQNLSQISQTDCIEDVNNISLTKREKQTSANKVKKVDFEDFIKIKESVSQSESLWQKRAFIMFEASIFFGLRPSEWEFAEIIEAEDGLWLKIKNGKNTNNRANGEYRYLKIAPNLEYMAQVIIEDVRGFLEKDSFEHYYENARTTFYHLMRKLFPKRKKHYSLYSSRHQFSANMKNLFSREEVANLMGHKSIETAALHYGKKRSGWKEYLEIERKQDFSLSIKPI
jgi:integrase